MNANKEYIDVIINNYVQSIPKEIRMSITPIGPRVLIKPFRQDEKTKGGIYIPESAKEKKKQGDVISVGTFEDGKDLPLKAGDKVLYGGYSQEEVELDKEDYVIVEFKNIIAKFD